MDILDHAAEINATSDRHPVEMVECLLEVVSIATPERYGIAFVPTNGIRNTMVLSDPR